MKKPVQLAKKLPKDTAKNILADFTYTYDCTESLFKDFTRYLVYQGKTPNDAAQTRNRVIYVWNCLDPKMCLNPNRLKCREDIEDLYFLKLYPDIVNLAYEKPEDLKYRQHNQASTVGARLLAVDTFLNFLEVRDIYIGKYYKPYIT